MTNSRSRFGLASPLLALLVCQWLSSVSGYPYPDEQLSVEDDGQYREQPWRVKRMSQISCHCCSNSFNSHCCLQCMQRIGKRSDSLGVYDTLSLTEGGDASDSELTHGLSAEAAACDCCLHQMLRSPSADWWPCCDLCKSRHKRSAPTAPLIQQEAQA